MPTVAILGASADRTKFGNKAVREFLARGYTVYPVNPKGGEVEGLPGYSRWPRFRQTSSSTGSASICRRPSG